MKSTARMFAGVRKLFALLHSETGFEPYSFVMFAYGEAEDGRENLRRSFRYELEGCCSHLTVEAPLGSPWRRRVLKGLAQAGYEPWFSGDNSADLRRWLRTASERRREFRLLEELGPDAAMDRWPQRAATTKPASPPYGRRSRVQWARVIDEAREARMAWDELGLCFSRSGKRAAPTRSGLVTITVSLIPYRRRSRGGGMTLLVCADVCDTTDMIPPRLARTFRRVLREAGFGPDGARSVRDGKRLRGRVGFQKELTTESSAAQTCLRVYDALLDTALP